ncbi:MAG: hypothetical protein A2Y23_03710 [Clostridiales bacterium GWB2_37_7]|nr:MAG: hypothetical protein A2Y23_03710 [Clostridiales bacterium GWB2_37_7]
MKCMTENLFKVNLDFPMHYKKGFYRNTKSNEAFYDTRLRNMQINEEWMFLLVLIKGTHSVLFFSKVWKEFNCFCRNFMLLVI